MFSKKIATISVYQEIATTLSSRDVVDILLNKIINKTKAKRVILDFDKVEFVSRSAAHELLNLKRRFSTRLFNKKKIYFDNYTTEVDKIFKAVKREEKKIDNDVLLDIKEDSFKDFLKEHPKKQNA